MGKFASLSEVAIDKGNGAAATTTKVPITVRVSYEVLKRLLKLPDDVEVLGIAGVNDLDGSFPIILETPVHHIKCATLSMNYRQDDSGTTFVGFD